MCARIGYLHHILIEEHIIIQAISSSHRRILQDVGLDPLVVETGPLLTTQNFLSLSSHDAPEMVNVGNIDNSLEDEQAVLMQSFESRLKGSITISAIQLVLGV